MPVESGEPVVLEVPEVPELPELSMEELPLRGVALSPGVMPLGLVEAPLGVVAPLGLVADVPLELEP